MVPPPPPPPVPRLPPLGAGDGLGRVAGRGGFGTEAVGDDWPKGAEGEPLFGGAVGVACPGVNGRAVPRGACPDSAGMPAGALEWPVFWPRSAGIAGSETANRESRG